jgi:serine/threonine-protein kinase
MGEVWRGTRESDGVVAAVKRLHTHLARNDEARAMFAREQKLATSLASHPNVVGAYESGAVDDRPFVAMHLVEGDDLRKLAHVGTARAKMIVSHAARGVAHLHSWGWVHGDVCPGNLVVDRDRVVIVDLGVVREVGAGGPMRGTHAYMAPEQVRGDAWTPATDVFALGVILWELVAEKRLFHRGPPWLTMAAVIEAVPDDLEDPALNAIVKAALDKDPEKRTPTAAALVEQLA